MEVLKNIGGALIGIAAFVGIIVAIILFFTVGAQVGAAILPFVSWLTGILVAINVIALLIAISRKARGVSGIIIYISSYIYGLQTWITGLLVTLSLWGWIAVIVGLFLGGVGVVPIGMLAAIFNGEWGIFFVLLLSVILTYGARIIGMALAESSEK
jgi:hypothetical protein